MIPIEGYKPSKPDVFYSWKKWFDGEFYSDYQNFHTLATTSFKYIVQKAREEKKAKLAEEEKENEPNLDCGNNH